LGLLLSVVFVVSLLADAFVIKPALRYIHDLDDRIVATKAELVRSRGVIQYADSVRQQYSSVKDLLGVTGQTAETIEAFKKELDELAINHGVQLRSMRHISPEETDHLLTYTIEVGDYEADISSLLRFLHAVNRAPGLMRIRTLSITSQSTDTVVSGTLSVTRVMTRSAIPGAVR
jgi:hypothetical protein